MADTSMSDCSPMSNPTDPHANWLARLAEFEASTPESEDLLAEHGELSDLLALTQAQTPAGAAAQLEWYMSTIAPQSGMEALQSVLAMLRRLS